MPPYKTICTHLVTIEAQSPGSDSKITFSTPSATIFVSIAALEALHDLIEMSLEHHPANVQAFQTMHIDYVDSEGRTQRVRKDANSIEMLYSRFHFRDADDLRNIGLAVRKFLASRAVPQPQPQAQPQPAPLPASLIHVWHARVLTLHKELASLCDPAPCWMMEHMHGMRTATLSLPTFDIKAKVHDHGILSFWDSNVVAGVHNCASFDLGIVEASEAVIRAVDERAIEVERELKAADAS